MSVTFTSENTMKKILSIGLLTVCALAISEHQAQAWVNCKFQRRLELAPPERQQQLPVGLLQERPGPGPEAFGGGMPYGNVPFGTNPPGGSFPVLRNGPQPMPQTHPAETAPPPVRTSQQAYYGNYNPYQAGELPNRQLLLSNYYYPTYNQYYAAIRLRPTGIRAANTRVGERERKQPALQVAGCFYFSYLSSNTYSISHISVSRHRST